MSTPIITTSDSIKIARGVFERSKYEVTEECIIDLSKNITLVEEKGLSKLNNRLIAGGRHIQDTLVEHNYAATILPILGPEASIEYEPEGLHRPPDFKIVREGITYWIQIKNLSILERENRQDKILQEIERQIREIEVGMFLGCQLNDDFSRDDIESLLTFVRSIINEANIGQAYFFPNESTPKAKIEFWLPNKLQLSHLTLGISGDIDIVEQTGLAQEQIKNSIVNAAGAFKWISDEKTINLIAMDCGRYDDIDICDALFGTEYDEISQSGRHCWCRKENGLFKKSPYDETVFGVISLRKKDKWAPIISTYTMSFFLNDTYKDSLDCVTSLFPFVIIVQYNMRPPIGHANFII
ncbi:MAG: hypothetical protein ABSA71_00670 [Desulfomonilia bacterium]|jgi:hypothetical protein